MFGCLIPKIQTRFLSNFLSTQNFCSLRSWVTVDLPVNLISSNTTLHLTLSHMPTALLNNWLSLRHREQPQPHRPKKRSRSSILNVEFLTREPVLHIGLEEIQARADPKNVPGPAPWMLCSWPNNRSCFLDIEKNPAAARRKIYTRSFLVNVECFYRWPGSLLTLKKLKANKLSRSSARDTGIFLDSNCFDQSSCPATSRLRPLDSDAKDPGRFSVNKKRYKSGEHRA